MRPGALLPALTASQVEDVLNFAYDAGEYIPARTTEAGLLPAAAGNVRTERLTDIYRTSPLFTGLRDRNRLTGRCGACEFAAVCGGSRSRAFALTDDPYAEDPWCSYQPGSFPYPDDLAAADPRLTAPPQ